MMEDPLIEKNDGLNGMSADDGGSSDLDETEDEGSDAFTTPLAQYKPHDDHLGLRRRRRTNVSYSDELNLIRSEPAVAPNRRSLFPNHIRRIMFITWPFDDIYKILNNAADHILKKIEPQLFYEPSHDGHFGLLLGRIKLSLLGETQDLISGFRDDVYPLPSWFWDDDYLLTSWFRTIDDDYLLNGLIDLLMPLTKRPPLTTKRPSPKFDLISKCLNYVSGGGPMIDQIFQSTLKLKIEPQLLNNSFEDHSSLKLISFSGGTQYLSSWFRGDDYLLNRLIDLAGGVDEVSQMISPPTVIAAAGIDCNLNLGTASVVTARHTEQRITPSILLLMNTPHLIDIQEGNSNDEEVHDWSQKMDFEWIFVITNIVLESISAIFTQLSSKQKPQYALFGMLLSYLALLTCITELIYEGCRHQQIPIQRRRRGKSFATLNNIVALACALGQCVVTTINYSFQSPIKLTISSIILAIGVLFSKILKY